MLHASLVPRLLLASCMLLLKSIRVLTVVKKFTSVNVSKDCGLLLTSQSIVQ